MVTISPSQEKENMSSRNCENKIHLRHEGFIIIASIIIIYIIAIPITYHTSNTYTYNNVTLKCSKVKALGENGVTQMYTLELKGPITYKTTPIITINNQPVTLSQQFIRDEVIYLGKYSQNRPITRANIYDITFHKATALLSKIPITFLILTIITILLLLLVSTQEDKKKIIKYRRIVIAAIALIAFIAFLIENTSTTYEYTFPGYSFTAQSTVNVVTKGTVVQYTPFTAHILPIGTNVNLTITVPGSHTLTADYIENVGYVFTASRSYKNIWIKNTTAHLHVTHHVMWPIATVYFIIFGVFFTAVLFAYSYFLFDIIDYEPEKDEKETKNDKTEENCNKKKEIEKE